MKRFLFFFFALVLISSAFADYDLDTLSSQQRQQFLLNSLSVEVGSQTDGYMVSGTNVYGKTALTTGSLSSSTSVVWTPYLGGNEISKSDFFQITGDEASYKKVLAFEEERAANKKTMVTLYGVGFSLAGIGLIIECIPLFTDDYSDGAMRTMLLGAGIALGGCTIALCGLPYEKLVKQDVNISAQYAIGVADAYNYELFQRISLNINL